jgi:hypothetical protein
MYTNINIEKDVKEIGLEVKNLIELVVNREQFPCFVMLVTTRNSLNI